MPYHFADDEASIDIEMIRLLLNHDGETVWKLFLISMNECDHTGLSAKLKRSWLEARRELIRARAPLNHSFLGYERAVSTILERVFSNSKVMQLREEFADVERAEAFKAQRGSASCNIP